MASSRRIKAVAGALLASLSLFLLMTQSTANRTSVPEHADSVSTLHEKTSIMHVQLKDGSYSETVSKDSTSTSTCEE